MSNEELSSQNVRLEMKAVVLEEERDRNKEDISELETIIENIKNEMKVTFRIMFSNKRPPNRKRAANIFHGFCFSILPNKYANKILKEGISPKPLKVWHTGLILYFIVMSLYILI